MLARSPLKAAPFVVCALVSAIAFAAVYLFFVRSYMGQLVDERAFAGADAWQTAVGDHFLDALPYVSVGAAMIIGVVLVSVRRTWRVFVVAVGAAAAANISTQVLKYVVLARPDRGVDQLSNSLPSGHTTVAASAGLVVFLLAAPRFRPLVAVLAAAWAVLTGGAVLINQWHRPSDVIAALLVVGFWGSIAGCALRIARARTSPAPVASRLLPLVWITIGLALIGAIGLAVTYLSTLAGGSHLFIAYVGGLAAIAAVSFGLAVVGNRLFRWLA